MFLFSLHFRKASDRFLSGAFFVLPYDCLPGILFVISLRV